MQTTLVKNAVVNLSTLEPYHRFYFFNDPAKKVWQVKEHALVKIRIGWKKLTVCVNDNNEKKRFDSGRSVVFLRDNYVNLKTTVAC